MLIIRACATVCAAITLLAAAPISATTPAPEAFSSVNRYGEMLASQNSALSVSVRRELAGRVLLLSSYYQLDPRLLIALVSVESAWRSRAVSSVGARGLGQLMPGTAAALNVDAFETYENLDGTARYLRRLLMRFPQYAQRTRYRYALAAYNAGPGAVDRYHGVPPYSETRSYVTRVMGLWEQFTHQTATIPSREALAYIHSSPPAIRHIAHQPVKSKPVKRIVAYVPAVRAQPTRASYPTAIAFSSPLPLATETPTQYEPRRGIFGFLHHRRVAHSSAPGNDVLAEQSAYYRPMPHSALRRP
jgi:hypothetical protein